MDELEIADWSDLRELFSNDLGLAEYFTISELSLENRNYIFNYYGSSNENSYINYVFHAPGYAFNQHLKKGDQIQYVPSGLQWRNLYTQPRNYSNRFFPIEDVLFDDESNAYMYGITAPNDKGIKEKILVHFYEIKEVKRVLLEPHAISNKTLPSI